MKRIAALDAAVGKEITFGELGVCRTFYWAYRNSLDAGTDDLDFEDVIWEQDIPDIVENCRRFEIKRFTISSRMSSLTETIAEFEKNGCRLIGLTQVPSRFTETTADWEEKRRINPAFEIKILPA